MLNLVMIGQIVKKWQPFFEIQDGGDRRFSRPRVKKTPFSFINQTAYLTVPCATALACDTTVSALQHNRDIQNIVIRLNYRTD